MSEISVLVPSYNHAPFVEQTLRSIFSQTLKPEKLLVIDDGSKDESVGIIERVLQDCPFEAEFIFRENRGLCATLNEGFARTDGEFFAYISSDDVWLPTFLEKRIEPLKKRPQAVLAYGHSYLINKKDEIFDCTKNWGDYADGNALEMLLYPQIPASASVVYRRSALGKFLWNESSTLEDYELYLRLSAAGEFALDEHILSAWRIHEYNASANFARMMNEMIEAQNRAADEIGLSDSQLRQAQAKLKFNCILQLIREGRKKEAARLLRNNPTGALSLNEIGKLAFRFLVPNKLLQWRRNSVRRKTIEKYGTLNY
jgi:alpha-1,3-rhamnosyltransferase